MYNASSSLVCKHLGWACAVQNGNNMDAFVEESLCRRTSEPSVKLKRKRWHFVIFFCVCRSLQNSEKEPEARLMQKLLDVLESDRSQPTGSTAQISTALKPLASGSEAAGYQTHFIYAEWLVTTVIWILFPHSSTESWISVLLSASRCCHCNGQTNQGCSFKVF